MAKSPQPGLSHSGKYALPPGRALDICNDLQLAILEHRLVPGMKLSEDEVGDLFGASRTVVRAALQALAHSELVTIERNRGAFVAQPSLKEAHEVFDARALIEPSLAGRAAKRASKRDLENLRRHIAAEHQALKSGDMGEALVLSGTFHIAISEIADQQVLTSIVRTLISRSSLIIGLYWRRPDTACESHSHEALLNAFADHDALTAEEIMKSHIIDLHSGLDLREKSAEAASLADLLQRK